VAGLTEAELDRFKGIILDPNSSEKQKADAARIVLVSSQSPQTTAGVAGAAQDIPTPAPEGLREELIAEQGTAIRNPRTGGPVPISGTPEFRAQESLAGEAAKQGVYERLTEMGDFSQRLFLDDTEEQQLADKRAKERAVELVDLFQQADALGMSREELMKSATVAGFAPDVVLSVIPMLGSTTPARLGAEALTMAFMVGSEVPLDEDATFATVAGAGGGFLMGLTAEIGQLRRVVANDVQKALKIKFDNLKNFSRRRPFQPTEASRTTGINQTVGETTQSSRVLNLERDAASRLKEGGPGETFIRQRELAAVKSFREMIDILDPSKLSTAGVVDGLRGVRQQVSDAIADGASATWREVMSPALEGVGARFGARRAIVGGPRFIQTAETRLELLRVRADASLPLTNNKPLVAWVDEQLELLDANNGVLKIGEYQKIVSGLGKGAISDGVVRNTDSLIQAMKTDLATTRVGFGDDATDAVIDALEDANKQFRAAIAPKDEVNAIYAQKLGLGGDGLSSEEFAKRFLDLPASQKEKVFADVALYAPELAQSISARTFSETVKRHTIKSTKDEFLDGPIDTLDLIELAKTLGTRNSTDMAVLLNIPNLSAQQSKLITSAFDQLAKMSNSFNTLGKASESSVKRAADFSINFFSRDTGFVARLAAGELTPGALERWLYTEKGLNALLDLGRSTLKPRIAITQTGTELALLTLMDLSKESDMERAAVEGEIIKRRRLKIAATK